MITGSNNEFLQVGESGPYTDGAYGEDGVVRLYNVKLRTGSGVIVNLDGDTEKSWLLTAGHVDLGTDLLLDGSTKIASIGGYGGYLQSGGLNISGDLRLVPLADRYADASVLSFAAIADETPLLLAGYGISAAYGDTLPSVDTETDASRVLRVGTAEAVSGRSAIYTGDDASVIGTKHDSGGGVFLEDGTLIGMIQTATTVGEGQPVVLDPGSYYGTGFVGMRFFAPHFVDTVLNAPGAPSIAYVRLREFSDGTKEAIVHCGWLVDWTTTAGDLLLNIGGTIWRNTGSPASVSVGDVGETAHFDLEVGGTSAAASGTCEFKAGLVTRTSDSEPSRAFTGQAFITGAVINVDAPALANDIPSDVTINCGWNTGLNVRQQSTSEWSVAVGLLGPETGRLRFLSPFGTPFEAEIIGESTETAVFPVTKSASLVSPSSTVTGHPNEPGVINIDGGATVYCLTNASDETTPNIPYVGFVPLWQHTNITLTAGTGNGSTTTFSADNEIAWQFTLPSTGSPLKRVKMSKLSGTLAAYNIRGTGSDQRPIGTYGATGPATMVLSGGVVGCMWVQASGSGTFRPTVQHYDVGFAPSVARDDGLSTPVASGTPVDYTISISEEAIGFGTNYIYVDDITNGDLTIDGNPVSVGDYIAISSTLGATFTPSASGASFTLGGSVGNSSDGIGLSATFTTATLEVTLPSSGNPRGRGRGRERFRCR